MIRSTIRMTIAPKKNVEAIKILRAVAEFFRYDSGCLSSHLYKDLQEKDVVMFEQVWRSEEDMRLHIRSDEYRKLLVVLEMASNQPEVKFDTISSST